MPEATSNKHQALGIALVLLVVGATVGLVGLVPVRAEVDKAVSNPAGVTATFEGRRISLEEGWGEASACLIWNEIGVSECFRTETQMDARIAELEASLQSADLEDNGIQTAGATCSGYLRLYDGTSYGSPVLYLRDRFQWLNLSGYGFDQKTSSYKVGPCYAYFADYANGG